MSGWAMKAAPKSIPIPCPPSWCLRAGQQRHSYVDSCCSSEHGMQTESNPSGWELPRWNTDTDTSPSHLQLCNFLAKDSADSWGVSAEGQKHPEQPICAGMTTLWDTLDDRNRQELMDSVPTWNPDLNEASYALLKHTSSQKKNHTELVEMVWPKSSV